MVDELNEGDTSRRSHATMSTWRQSRSIVTRIRTRMSARRSFRSHRYDSPASAGNLSRTLRRQQTDLATRSFFSGSHRKPQSHIGASQRLSRMNRKVSCARVKDGSFARGHVYGSAQKGVKESNPAYHRAESRRRVIWLLAGDRKERCNLKAEVPACLQCSRLSRRPVRRFPEPNIGTCFVACLAFVLVLF
jgi:hypothetical protein